MTALAGDTVHEKLAHGPPERVFLDGSEYWIVDLPTIRVGIGHFRPGWVWSEHAGPQTGKRSQAHIGIIQSGAMTVESADGSCVELGPGDAFEVGAGHDARVVGDETCVALDVTVRPNDHR